MPDFERLAPDSLGINVEDINRVFDQTQRQQSGYGASQPSFSSSAGEGLLPRPDVFRFLMIQVGAVTLNTTTNVYGYDWIEVVRLDGLYVQPDDGRSGTVYLPDGVTLNVPAYDIRGSLGTVPLNSGSQVSAYLAWLSWDERSLEFLGLPSAIVSNVACVANVIQVTKT